MSGRTGGDRGRAGPDPRPDRPQTLLETPRPGVRLETSGWLHPVLTLSGPGVDQSFKERLIAWLQGTG